MILVPHGVEHRPHADEEVSILLFEPAATLNTGNVVSEQRVTQVERI
jgi:mannose-6-phosphate isomerase-like protein (cupin superfamily)